MADGEKMFEISLDTDKLKQDAERAAQMLIGIGDGAKDASTMIENTFKTTTQRLKDELGNLSLDEAKDVISTRVEDQINELNHLMDELAKLQEAKANESKTGVAVVGYANEYRKLSEKILISKTSLEAMTQVEANFDAQIQKTSLSNRIKEFIRLGDTTDAYKEALSFLPAPIQSVITSINGMAKAALKFIATPLGAVLAAIVLALKAVFAWFNSSAEGQLAFAKASGYVSGVLGQLKEIVINVGEALYKAFSNPKEAVIALWDTIKENIVNRISGLGKIFESLGKIIASGFTDGYKELGDALMQTTTGVEGATDKIHNYISGINEAAVATSKLSEAEYNLQRRRSKWGIEEEKLNEKIRDAQLRLYSATSDSDRLQAANEAEELINKKYETRIELAKEDLRIKEETSALTSSTIEDLAEIEEAQALLNREEASKKSELMRFSRIKGAIGRKEVGAEGAEDLKMQQEAFKALEQMRRENTETEIALMEDGNEKKIRAINEAHTREIQAIRERESELKAIKEVSVEEQAIIDEALLLAEKKKNYQLNIIRLEQAEREEQDLIEFNKKYGDYADQREAIIKDYNRKIAEAQTEGSKMMLEADMNKALQVLDSSMIEQSDLWIRLFSNAEDQTTRFIKETIKSVEQLLDYLEGKDGSSKPIGFTEAQLKSLKEDPKKIKEVLKALKTQRDELNKRNPFTNLIIAFKDLADAGSDAEARFKASRKVLESLSEVGEMFGIVGDQLDKMGLKAGDTLNDIAETIDNTVNMAEKGASMGGLVGGAIGGAIGLTSSLASVFGGAKELSQETIKQYQNYMSVIDDLISKQDDLLRSTAGANVMVLGKEQEALILKQIEASREIGRKYLASGSGWFSHSKGYNERKMMNEYARELEAIGVSMDSLGKRATGLFDMSGKQLQEIKETVPAMWARFDEQTREYLEAIIASDEALEKLGQTQKEMLTGLSFDGVKDGLRSLLQDMNSGFEDAAKNLEDSLRNAIINTIIDDTLNNQLKAWYDNFAKAMEDGNLSEKEAKQLREEYYNIYEEAMALRDKALDVIGVRDPNIATQEATKGIVGSMSQDQISTFDGRLVSFAMTNQKISDLTELMQLDVEIIKSDLKISIEQAVEIKNIISLSLEQLQEINKNTRELVPIKQGIGEIVDQLRRIEF